MSSNESFDQHPQHYFGPDKWPKIRTVRPDGSVGLSGHALTLKFSADTVRLTHQPAISAGPGQPWHFATYTTHKDFPIGDAEWRSSSLFPGERPVVEIRLTGTEGVLPIPFVAQPYEGDESCDDPRRLSDYAREQYMTEGSLLPLDSQRSTQRDAYKRYDAKLSEEFVESMQAAGILFGMSTEGGSSK